MNVIAGGTVSQLSGGKFANGAVSSAFVWMFNEHSHMKIASKKLNVISLLDKWAKGEGGEYFFDQDHPMTIDLQNSPELQKAINQWILEEHAVGDKAFLKVSFFPIGKGMMNLTRQFVGTFTASVYQLDKYKIGVLLFNNTSLKSAMYHIGLPDDFGKRFNLKQYYYFEESY